MKARRWTDAIQGIRAALPIGRFRAPAPRVSVLRLSGAIGAIGPVRRGLSLDGLERVIDRAFAPRRLSAVALRINSPGGSPVQAAQIAARIREQAAKRDVPVISFIDDVAASGGYWLAMAADEIHADANSIVGSIGVISAGFGFPELLARHGIERRVHVSGARKDMLDPFRPERPEDVARLAELQADIHESFKAEVRARRGAALKASEDTLFNGDIWSGREALALGLVDGLGELRATMRARFGDRVRLRVYAPDQPWLRRRFGLGAATIPADWAGEALAAVEEYALWRRFR